MTKLNTKDDEFDENLWTEIVVAGIKLEHPCHGALDFQKEINEAIKGLPEEFRKNAYFELETYPEWSFGLKYYRKQTELELNKQRARNIKVCKREIEQAQVELEENENDMKHYEAGGN